MALARCLQGTRGLARKKLGVSTALCLLTCSTAAFAADLAVDRKVDQGGSPRAGLFFGLGGSYNSVKLDRDIFAIGFSDIYSGSTLTARGYAAGPGNPFHENQSGFAPEGQAGYFSHFANSNWLWGVKANYRYLGTTSTERGLIIPQFGGYVPAGGGAETPLTGNVIIQTAETRIDHQSTFLAFVGRSFGTTTVYLGAGPALFGTKSKLNHAIGFGQVNGTPTDITGAPDSFSSSKWVWGGAGQIGMTYSFAPTWFLDFNYTYAMTGRFKTNYATPFVSNSAGLTYTGVAFITTNQRITAQSLSVTINKAF